MATKRIIAILSGQIQKTGDAWHTEENDGPGDSVGPTYTRFRVAAGAYLAGEYADALVVAAGAAFLPDSPSIASVVRDELIQLGVPPERILMAETPRKTREDLEALSRLVTEHACEELIVISNEWHLPRAAVMARSFPAFQQTKTFIMRCIPAEEVLLQHADIWEKAVERERNDPRIAKLVALEQKGIADLIAGKYR